MANPHINGKDTSSITAAVIFMLSAVILHAGSAALHTGVGSFGYIRSAGLWVLLAIGIGLATGAWKALFLALIPWPIGIILGPAIGRFPGLHSSLWLAAPESILIGVIGVLLGVAARKGLSLISPPTMHVRRRIYGVLFAVGVLLLIGMAFWNVQHQPNAWFGPNTFLSSNIHLFILGFVILAVVGLLSLRPEPALYALGLGCLLFAFIGFWLASPSGRLWTAQILLGPTYGLYGGRIFGWLFLLFPAGWLLLAMSVSDWRVSGISYLAPGFIFVVTSALVLGIPDTLTSLLFFVGYFLFAWPLLAFAMLGMFGMTLPG